MCETAVTVGLVTIPSTAAAAPAADTGYDEPYRPQFHYTPRQNWMNDPNGPIVYKGQYHLFYQYNPEGNQWGNMSRGHAVSKDLVSWKELPLAIPFDDRELIFSGGVVNDKNNSSGREPARTRRWWRSTRAPDPGRRRNHWPTARTAE